MESKRILYPSELRELESFLIPDPCYPSIELIEDLIELMLTSPRSFFGKTLKEDSKILGFVLAYQPIARICAWLEQAWCDPKCEDKKWTKKTFDEVVQWAKSLGLKEIRAETERSPEAFLRRWGFESFSATLRFKL